MSDHATSEGASGLPASECLGDELDAESLSVKSSFSSVVSSFFASVLPSFPPLTSVPAFGPGGPPFLPTSGRTSFSGGLRQTNSPSWMQIPMCSSSFTSSFLLP